MPGLSMTRSPTFTVFTSGPTDSTTPAPSAPTMCGKRSAPPGIPSATKRSRWFKAAARTLIRTSPMVGAGASGTSVIWRWSRPPLAVRTQARTGGRLNLRPERRRNHLLCPRGGHRDRGRRADRLDIDPIRGIAAILRLGVDDQRDEVTGRRNGERCDRQIGAGQRRDVARRQIGAHHLLHGAIAVPPFDQIGECTIPQEVGLGFALLRGAGKLALVRAVAAHEPDVGVLIACRDIRDGLPVGGHRGRCIDRVTRELRESRAVEVHAPDLLFASGARARRMEDNGLPIGRERRPPIRLRIIGHPHGPGAIRIHHVDLATTISPTTYTSAVAFLPPGAAAVMRAWPYPVPDTVPSSPTVATCGLSLLQARFVAGPRTLL